MITPTQLARTPGACYVYFGDHGDWTIAPTFTRNRDSDAMERSNFEVVWEALTSAYPDEVEIERDGHFLVGWCESILIAPGSRAHEMLADFQARYDAYCLLDEERYSEMEWNDNHPSDTECYAEDCSCEIAFRQRRREHLLALVRGQL